MTTQDIVQKLWNLCDVLRDDGINYSDYVTELVLLLFIKMEHESTESGVLHKHKLPDYAAGASSRGAAAWTCCCTTKKRCSSSAKAPTPHCRHLRRRANQPEGTAPPRAARQKPRRH